MSSPACDALTAEYRDAARLDARIALHQHYSVNPQSLYAWIFDHLQAPATGWVLDIGCGSGRLWLDNQVRLPARWTVILADHSAGMVQATAKELAGAGPFHFATADIQALPFADQQFDAVVATHMLYHVPDRPQAYREIRRLVRSGGRFYASTNSRTTMQRYDELVAQARGTAPPRPADLRNDGREARGFTLEHGGHELADFFHHVSLHTYEDAIVVSEAAPLVAYAAAAGHLAGDALQRFQQAVEEVIHTEGSLRIDKSAGLFEVVV